MLWFRYRIEFRGLDQVGPETLNRPGGVLFLPNHPCVFIDPVVATLGAWKKYPIRPMVVEYFYYYPFIHKLLRFLDALPVPNFSTSSNSLKRKRSEEVFEEVIRGLKKGDNFLIYPAGGTKNTSKEILGGASGLHRILSDVPQANIVLVRIKGLWGSRFSRYWTGKAPPMFEIIKWGVKEVLKDLLFFAPRRKVIVEYLPAPADFPRDASRLEINRYLENWYNLPDGMTPQEGEHPGDSLILRPYSIWSKSMPTREVSEAEQEDQIDLLKVPQETQEKVLRKLSELSEIPVEKIKMDMTIASEIGLDSLDTAELSAFLHDVFEVAGVPVSELTTVGKVMAIASGHYVVREEPDEPTPDLGKWLMPVKKERAYLADGETIAEVFLNAAAKYPKKMCLADDRMGALDYKTVRLRAIILAEQFKKLPGDSVGILLPASVAAVLCILACELAGKVPVLINWTVGPRHLETVKELSKIQATISSWAFIDRLEGVELNGLEDQMVMLEDMRRGIGLGDKLRGCGSPKNPLRKLLRRLIHGEPAPRIPRCCCLQAAQRAIPRVSPFPTATSFAISGLYLKKWTFIPTIRFSVFCLLSLFGFTISSLIGPLPASGWPFIPNLPMAKNWPTALKNGKSPSCAALPPS